MDTIPFAPSLAAPESLRGLYLKRLERLQRLRQQHQQELNSHGLRLLDRAVFAAYCECRDAGAETEARKLLSGATCPVDRGQ
jgi:hypothetical protein